MKIPIIPLSQEDNKDCGITCLRMVLDYYGYSVSSKEIREVVGEKGFTPFETDLARFANYKGLNVDCIAYNLYLTDPKDPYIYPRLMIKKLEDEKNKPSFDQDFVNQVDSVIEAMKAGVNWIIQRPDFKVIRSYINKKIPLIVAVNSLGLYGRQGADPYVTHAVIVNGIKGDNVYLIDPSDGKEVLINKDNLMMGIYTKKFTASSAWLLAIKKVI